MINLYYKNGGIMMIRTIIEIDKETCNGCGACAIACHEGAIQMVDGKANLMRDDYCDGLGDCLPVCPVDAIHFVQRDTLAYDEKAVLENKQQKAILPCGCSGNQVKNIHQDANCYDAHTIPSQLQQWPVQLKLVPVNAPYFENANLLIAADCSAYAYANFHQHFMKHKITLIGCPKLDMVEYSEKLTEIIKQNTIQSIQVVRMQVPCCGGLTHAVEKAIQDSGKHIALNIIILSSDGQVIA